VASPKWDVAAATFAAEVGRQNGPFDNPENWDKYKLFNKLTFKLTPTSTLSIAEMSYGATGTVGADPRAGRGTGAHHPVRLDGSQRGRRYHASPGVRAVLAASERAQRDARLAYVGTYTFDLFSNFTCTCATPTTATKSSSKDRRTFYGAKMSYRIVHELAGVRFDTTIGGDVRSDDIDEMLWTRPIGFSARPYATTVRTRRSSGRMQRGDRPRRLGTRGSWAYAPTRSPSP